MFACANSPRLFHVKQSPPAWTPFAALTEAQREQLAAYRRLLLGFNRKINLISREDEAHARRHVRHALALAWRAFPAGSAVVDWGTGGGLPAIPLAICFPQIEVHAVDAVEKKIRAVQAMGRRLGLENLHAYHGRAEDWPSRASYSVSRATAPLETLWRWHRRAAAEPVEESGAACWQPGLLCLKGGALEEEIAALRAFHPEAAVEQHSLKPLLGDDFFAGKYIVHASAGRNPSGGN